MTALTPASPRPPRLVLRFAVYTAIALLLAGLGILWFVRHEAETRAEREVAAHAGRLTARMEQTLRASDFERPVDARRAATLDRAFRYELVDGLLRIKLWNREGVVTYSSTASLIGDRAVDRAEIDEALSGKTVQGIGRLNDEGGPGPNPKTIETYEPITLPGSSEPVGAFEVYQDFRPVATDVRRAVTSVAIALALALLLLYATLLPILRQVTKTLSTRNERLSEHAAALGRALEEREAVERRLTQAERQYRTLIEQLPLVTYIDNLDETSSAIYISPQVEGLLGYPAVAWLSDPEFFPKVLHPDDRERVLAEHWDAYETGRFFTEEYRLIAKDGRVVWVQDQVMVAQDEDGRPLHAQGFLIDVSERKAAEETLERRREELEVLNETALELLDELDVDRVLERVVTRAGKLVGTESCYVYVRSEEREDELVVRVGTGVFADRIGYSLRRGEGVAGRVWETGEPFAVDDYRSYSGHRPDLADNTFKAVVGVPLFSRREVVAVIGLAHSDERTFGEADLAVLLRFARLASLALESARLYASARQSEAQFKALVSNVPGAIFHCEFDADWTMAFLSDAIEEISGHPASDFVGNAVRSYASIVHPDDAAALEEAVGEGEPYSVEYRILHADGGVRWVLERGQAVVDADGHQWLEGAIFDITEQKGAENERLKLASIVESSEDAIMSASLDGRFTSWNAGAEKMFGYSADEVLGEEITLISPADRGREAMWRVNEILRKGEVVKSETVRRRKDGTPVDVAFTYSPIRSARGEIAGVSAIAHDISEQKRAEKEREALLERAQKARAAAEAAKHDLEAQNERLRELDKLKDDFIALVSHELRTPLTSIRGYTELLVEGEAGDLTEEQRQFLGVVERNSHRLLHLVGDLLLLAQIEAGKLVLDVGAVDVAAVASESVESVRPTADEKGVTLTLATGPVPLLAGDRGRLGQVLDNLVSNAVKFTPSGGRVDIRVHGQGGRAQIEVRDTGIGIPAAEQDRLFERFFRSSNATENAIQGTGLGLAIAKAIVEAHGGQIGVASDEGGTIFRVMLPVRESALTAERAEVAL